MPAAKSRKTDHAMTDDDRLAPRHVWQGIARGALPAAVYAIYLAVAAASVAGMIPDADVFLALSGLSALGIIAIGAGLRRHYVWAHTTCSELDEREQRTRARAYEFSYGVLIGAVFLVFVVPVLAIQDDALRAAVLHAGAFGFILLAATLPTATLAWRDRVGATGAVGVTGRVSRRTLIIWSICAVFGLVTGLFIGSLS